MDNRRTIPASKSWPAPLFALLLASGAEAASQGSVGGTSSGSVNITASVQARAEMSGSEDIEFEVTGSTDQLRISRDMCVFSNSVGGSYTISAEGSGLETALELSNGDQAVGYSGEWSPLADWASAGAHPGGSIVLNLTAAKTESECGARAGLARLVLVVDQVRLQPAQSGASNVGILNLTVSPQ